MHRLAQGHLNFTIVELDTNLGRARARNRVAEAVQSQFLSFLDHDDTYHPDFLRITASLLAAVPHVDAVKVQPHVSIPIDPVRYEALSNSMITSMLMGRSAYELIGGYPESEVFRTTESGLEDVAFARLFHATFYTGVINQQLYNYIIPPGQRAGALHAAQLGRRRQAEVHHRRGARRRCGLRRNGPPAGIAAPPHPRSPRGNP